MMRHSDLDAVAWRSFEEFLDVGLTRRWCSFCVGGERLSNLEEHLLQSGWCNRDQQPSRLLALVLAAVQAADRHVQERTFASDDSFFAQLEGHLAFKDEKRLLFSAVNVRWWTATGRHDGLERGVLAVSLVAGGEEAVQSPTMPTLRPSPGFRMVAGRVIVID
jgi:hypothetical protein